MDFIRNDKDLFTKLLKIGQEESNALNADKNAEALESILKNVEDNLKDYVPFKPEAQSSFHGGDQNNPAPKLFLNDLQTPISFLNYLKLSKVKYKSTILVYDHYSKTSMNTGLQNKVLEDEVSSLPPEQQKEYIKYPKPIDKKQDQFTYWIHKKYILMLLEDLQKTAQDNRLLEIRVGKIIQELSNNTGESFNPKDQAPSDKSGQPQLLDTLPKKINPKTTNENGPVRLMDTDLKTDQDFNNWVGKNGFSIITDDGELPAADKNNVCQLITYLYTRAHNAAAYNQDPTKRELAEFYAKQMLKISNTNSCGIGQSTTTNKPEQPNKNTNDRTPGLTDDQAAELFKKMVPYLPLNTRTIDFGKISVWLRVLNQALPPTNKFSSGDIDDLTQDAVLLLKNNQNAANYRFNLSQSGEDVIQSLKLQNSYNPFLHKLVEIVSRVEDSIHQLIYVYGDKLKADREAYAYILNQVGNSASDYSIALQNKSMLHALINKAPTLIGRR